MMHFKSLLTHVRGRIPQERIARAMGRPPEWLSRVCSGSVPLNAKSALGLEKATGLKAIDWMIASAMDQLEREGDEP